MDLNPLITSNALPAPQRAAVAQLFRLVTGDISQLPTGQTLSATVMKAAAGETVLALAGQQVTIKGTVPANPGEVVNVRVQPGAKPAVAVLGEDAAQPAPNLHASREGSTSTSLGTGVGPKNPAVAGADTPVNPSSQRTDLKATGYGQPTSASAEPVVVDVISREPNGQLRVRIDGREATATSQQPLQTGGRYVVQIDRSPVGLVLRPLPDSPQLSTTVATAILRTDKPPPLGDTLPSLVKELANVAARETLSVPQAESIPAGETRKAAAAVKEVAVRLLPSAEEPPSAEQIKQLVEDGGTHFEAKLARAADAPDAERPSPQTDLKSGLLTLARTVTNLSAAFPAAAATLDSIERQQAVNVLSQQSGGMAVFQIPFPDGAHWRTLGMGIEPDRNSEPDSSGRAKGFRVMMHVPLTTLGETWIDASAEANRLRAVLYVSDTSARDRVRAELPELRTELQTGGFGEVLLDVRSAADLTDAQRRKANAIREGVPEGGGLLDVTA